MDKLNNEMKVLNYLGFKNDVTEEVHEAIKTRGTNVAKFVNQRMNRAKQDVAYIVLTSETQFTVISPWIVTKDEIKQFSLILKLEYVKAGTTAQDNDLWLAYIGAEELPEVAVETEKAPEVLEGKVFESKAWYIEVSEDREVFLVNKRFASEGRLEDYVEVTAETVETCEIQGVKIPKYIREELAKIFAEMIPVKEDVSNLIIEHDRLEEFCATYKGKLSLNYEIERLRELKMLIKLNSIEEPIDGLVAERPYLALKEMAIERADQNVKTDVVIMRIHKDNLKRYILALSHLNVPYYEHEQINDELVEIIHDKIEKPFEEEVETMLLQREIIPIEIRAKLNLFSRYNELLMKSLKFNLSPEEQDEYNGLYEELKLNEGNNLYELMKASYEQRNG